MAKRFLKVFKKSLPKKSKKIPKKQKIQYKKLKKKNSKKEKKALPSFFPPADSTSFSLLNDFPEDSNESQELNFPNDLNILEPKEKSEQKENSFSEIFMG